MHRSQDRLLIQREHVEIDVLTSQDEVAILVREKVRCAGLRCHGRIPLVEWTREVVHDATVAYGGVRVKMDIDRDDLWSDRGGITVTNLWNAYARYPHMPRLSSFRARADAIGDGGGSEGIGDNGTAGGGEAKGDDGSGAAGATRLFAQFDLDSVRGIKQLGEMLGHLTARPGSNLELSLEVRATNAEGYDDAIQRIVTDNATNLGVNGPELE
jgi:hypothetical protein